MKLVELNQILLKGVIVKMDEYLKNILENHLQGGVLEVKLDSGMNYAEQLEMHKENLGKNNYEVVKYFPSKKEVRGLYYINFRRKGSDLNA